MKNLLLLRLFLCWGILVFACRKSGGGHLPTDDDDDLTHIPYRPTPYTIKKPDFYPEVPVPPGNPMTAEGVELGRMLFYDPILSGDSTKSCSSCHHPALSFTDGKAVSVGIAGISGKRSSMSLYNVAYVTGGFFWDGRVKTLEEQALLPVEDPIELNTTWQEVIAKLKKHPVYPEKFRKAFGITKKSEIKKELAARAIAQFERILIGSGMSKYDLYLNGKIDLDDDELDGRLMFFDEAAVFGVNLPDAQCFHCHGGITLTGNQFFNNGIDNVATLDGFSDKGQGGASGNRLNNGKFRAVTLRNIALTAPYMHDGRMKTLEEVVRHYATHGKHSPNKDPFINQIGFPKIGSNPIQYDTLSLENQRKIVKFLHTLTDTVFIKNPEFQNPFQ